MSWNITKPLIIKPKSSATSREKAFIFANYKTMTQREMARRLGRSQMFVERFMKKYNLQRNGNGDAQ